MNKIFIVDDDIKILKSLEEILSKNGYIVESAKSPDEFLDKIKDSPPAAAIIDIFYGYKQMDGEELIKILTEQYPAVQCIVMSGESDIQKTLSCLKNGALDFLEKPVSLPRLITSVKNAFNLYNTKSSVQARFDILGESKTIKNVIKRIKKLALLKECILIYGESGTGKELVAENLHLFSHRFSKTMYRVNCTALNSNLIESELFGHKKGSFTGADKDKKGYFELADQSSLFIDEIGDFDLNLQSKILRVLQENKITRVGDSTEINLDTRYIFATHNNLEKMIDDGHFRQDLYFRLSTFTIILPPLRERLEDIDILASHFLDSFLKNNNLRYKEFSEAALDKLKQHHYPGNVRELIKIIKNAAYFSSGEKIESDDIEFKPKNEIENILELTKNMTLFESKSYFEKQLILKRLKIHNGNIENTAKSLGIQRTNLYRKFKQLSISKI
jgi:two-component system nitrogen regulation response regulator NtrX